MMRFCDTPPVRRPRHTATPASALASAAFFVAALAPLAPRLAADEVAIRGGLHATTDTAAVEAPVVTVTGSTASAGPAAPAFAARTDPPPPAAADAASPYPGAYAFVNVHVVPMDAWRVLESQTVVVRNGVIREIGPVGSVEVPADATVIQGEGRYLLPGLADMYARLPGAGASEQQLADLLFLYLANGVTTVRQASGEPGHRELTIRLQREQLLGPTLYAASPPFRYRGVLQPDSVEAALTMVALERWDMLQPSEDLSRRAWDLLAEEIREYIIGLGGPVPESVGLHHALATGTSTVDRMDGLVEAAASEAYQARIRAWYASGSAGDAGAATGAVGSGSSSPETRPPPPPLDSLAASISLRRARGVAGKARALGAWMVPTLSGWELRDGAWSSRELLDRPEMRYVPREMRGAWATALDAREPVDSATAARLAEARMAAAKHLSDVGGGLLLGSDAPSLFNVPGFSIHREMELMRNAGITAYEVLLAGTRNVARYASTELRHSGSFGTVEAGNRADLILVEGNPLEDLSVLRSRAGVMVKGMWLPADEIEARLEAIAERWEGPGAVGDEQEPRNPGDIGRGGDPGDFGGTRSTGDGVPPGD